MFGCTSLGRPSIRWPREVVCFCETKRRPSLLLTNQDVPSLPPIRLSATVNHLDWRLGGGLWRADESEEPIAASEATAAVLCSPAHLLVLCCSLLQAPPSFCPPPPRPSANGERTPSLWRSPMLGRGGRDKGQGDLLRRPSESVFLNTWRRFVGVKWLLPLCLFYKDSC